MESVDRLSSLSDLVLHHVLSFLTIQDVAKLCFASKKYLNVCLSVPSLSIDISSDEGSLVQRNQFMDFIVNFIKSRRGTQMTKLSITWHSPKLTWNQAFRVFSWLNHAMACHLNEIDLTLDLQSGTFLLPLEVFWCESLRSLTINLYQCKLELPSPHCFSHLKYLHLLYVQVVDESLGEWISSTCKFLEILKLQIVSGVQIFRISSASLLEITVSGCSFDYLDISAQLLHTISLYLSATALLVNVYAPNLFEVRYSGVFPKLSSVEMKKIELKYFVSLDLRNWTNGLQSFLTYIVPVTDLVIDCNSIQVLYENKSLHMEVDLAGGKLELPSPYGFSYLKFLHLSGLEVVDEALGDWISSTCRFLEKLKLIRICGVNKFRIKSASLQAINVSECRFQYIEISAQLLHTISLGVATSALSVNICAPYLFQVDCSGVFPEYFSMEIIKTEAKYFVSLCCNDTCSRAPVELRRLLYNIAPVTKLVIDSSAIQLLYETKYFPCAFPNLKSVVLSYNYLTDITSPATVLFLQMLPRNLKKLRMDCGFAHDSIEWEWKNFVFIDELEEVEIDLADGRENEEKLVEYFLENAKRLVKITVSSRYNNMSPEIKLKLTEVASAKGGDLRSKRNMVVLELKPREQV